MVDWAIVTGEYPPQTGGVSDYTRQIAEGLIDAGAEVAVFAPEIVPRGNEHSFVHRLPGRFGPRGLWRLKRELDRLRPRRILLQYTPHAFGWKAANLPLCLLLSHIGANGCDLRIMYHEVALPFMARRPAIMTLAMTQRLMAQVLGTRAQRVYVSTPSWRRLIGSRGSKQEARWLPVPANVPSDPPASFVATARRAATNGDSRVEVIGHFGTFGDAVTPLLRPLIGSLFEQRPNARLQLIGRGADRFRRSLNGVAWGDRVSVAENLTAVEVSARLKASDVVVQPYPDGVTTRRSTAMASLACGAPLVTNLGALSEPLWKVDAPAAAAHGPDPAAVAALAGRLLDDADLRRRLGDQGRAYYDRTFSIRHSIQALLDD